MKNSLEFELEGEVKNAEGSCYVPSTPFSSYTKLTINDPAYTLTASGTQKWGEALTVVESGSVGFERGDSFVSDKIAIGLDYKASGHGKYPLGKCLCLEFTDSVSLAHSEWARPMIPSLAFELAKQFVPEAMELGAEGIEGATEAGEVVVEEALGAALLL